MSHIDVVQALCPARAPHTCHAPSNHSPAQKTAASQHPEKNMQAHDSKKICTHEQEMWVKGHAWYRRLGFALLWGKTGEGDAGHSACALACFKAC